MLILTPDQVALIALCGVFILSAVLVLALWAIYLATPRRK